MSQKFDFENLVLLCQHIRAISATPSRISQESMSQIPQTLYVESPAPSLIGMAPANSAILQTLSAKSITVMGLPGIRQTPSAKFITRDPEIPGIGPTLSVESFAPETIDAARER